MPMAAVANCGIIGGTGRVWQVPAGYTSARRSDWGASAIHRWLMNASIPDDRLDVDRWVDAVIVAANAFARG